MQIDTQTFFKFGVASFTIIGFCQIANLIIFFKTLNIFSGLASVAQIVFNFVTALFFVYLLKTSVPHDPSFKDSTTEELMEAIKNDFN